VLKAPARSSKRYGLRVANVFHAGDGNMHPLILYNVNDPAEQVKADAPATTFSSSASTSAAASPASTASASRSAT
jgi:FAD/FMN-containing dehydrogenase